MGERERQAGWDDKYLLGSYKMHPKATSGKLSGKCGGMGRAMSMRLIAIITMLLIIMWTLWQECVQTMCARDRGKGRERERESQKMCSMPLGARAEDIRIHYELRCSARNP